MAIDLWWKQRGAHIPKIVSSLWESVQGCISIPQFSACIPSIWVFPSGAHRNFQIGGVLVRKCIWHVSKDNSTFSFVYIHNPFCSFHCTHFTGCVRHPIACHPWFLAQSSDKIKLWNPIWREHVNDCMTHQACVNILKHKRYRKS